MLKFSKSRVIVQFTNLIEEYNAVHRQSGLFDLSQTGVLLLTGKNVKDKLQEFVPTDLNRIGTGESCQTMLLNQRGGINHTITVHDLGQKKDCSEIIIIIDQIYMATQINWISKKLKLYEITVTDLRKTHILMALEGPMAGIHLNEVTANEMITEMPLLTNCILHLNGIHKGRATYAPSLIIRTSYTGNDGFQILLQSDQAVSLWKNFIIKGIKPCGLAIWDILRLENFLQIYGYEVNNSTSPFEISLSQLIHLEIPQHFTGRQSLDAQTAANNTYCISALIIESSMVPNQNCCILHNGDIVGRITSSSWSPFLNQSIAFGYLPLEIAKKNEKVKISLYNEICVARVLKTPFSLID